VQDNIGILAPIIEFWDVHFDKSIINCQWVETEQFAQEALTAVNRFFT
jgi:hypothetical protein